MASMGGGQLDPEPLIRLVKSAGMVNRTLQDILNAEGQSKTGVKADLQQRIIGRLRLHADNHDRPNFERLKKMIENPRSIHQNGAMNYNSSSPATSTSASYLNNSATSYGSRPNMGGGLNNYRGYGHQSLEFKPSPFYSFLQQLGEPKELAAMAQHRHTVNIQLKMSEHGVLSRVLNEPSLGVMVFCAAEGQGRQDVAFPHQSEIKVNGGEVKANLRGLKNKPGSTRPVDITKELRLKTSNPNYQNAVEMTYALTNKVGQSQKFYLVIWVVKIVPVADLVKKIEVGRRITKDSVINEMASKARDADIVATASVLSLKCPLSTLRIDLPCRSTSCRHNQCFDATSYLQLQEQGPTWLCPICNNPAPFESLAVDEYVKDILKSTSRSVDQVTIQPNAKWELHSKSEPSSKLNGVTSDDDDDLVEITKSGDSVRMYTPREYRTPTAGLAQASREQSTSSAAPRGSGSTSGKRPIAAVIDLTSSGDEDDEPLIRAPKRQFTTNGYGTPSNVPVYRPAPANGYTPRT